MNTSDAVIDMYARVTWAKLKTDPLEDYETLSKNDSGKVIIQAHKDFIRCLIVNDFDVRRATKVFSGGRGTFGELEPSGQEFRTRLAEMLQQLVKEQRG